MAAAAAGNRFANRQRQAATFARSRQRSVQPFFAIQLIPSDVRTLDEHLQGREGDVITLLAGTFEPCGGKGSAGYFRTSN